MVDLNELARKRGLFIDNAATASQNETLIDDGVTREAIELNVIAPLIVEISERDQRIAALEAKLAERVKVEDVLDAASVYMKTKYGIGALSHPTDRGRIVSALEATPPAPKVTEDMVDAFIDRYKLGCSHRYDRNSIRAALTAAQEAGR